MCNRYNIFLVKCVIQNIETVHNFIMADAKNNGFKNIIINNTHIDIKIIYTC